MTATFLRTAAFFLAATSLAAQQSTSATGGSVSGTVTCDDTQRPARFAQVMLFGIPTEVTPPPKLDGTPDPAQLAAVMKSTMGATLVQTQTGIDGQYTALNVAPGDYYVFASVAGYLQPAAIVRAAQAAGVDLSKPIPGIPTVHVAGDRPLRADITVSRGGALSGKVLWDDGSPVTRAIVSVVPASGKEKELPSQFAMLNLSNVLGSLLGITDDLGHFRLAGLAPGDYLIQATLETHSGFGMVKGRMNLKALAPDTPLAVFAPAAFHRADAKPVTLHSGEDRSDIEVTFNLAGLHTVSGLIASAETHHPVNSGRVKLEDTQDKDFSRTVGIDAHGNYSISFVPPGNYNLTVDDGADTEDAPENTSGKSEGFAGMFSQSHTLRSYDPGKLAIVVIDSDLADRNLELTPSKTTKKDVDLNKVFNPGN